MMASRSAAGADGVSGAARTTISSPSRLVLTISTRTSRPVSSLSVPRSAMASSLAGGPAEAQQPIYGNYLAAVAGPLCRRHLRPGIRALAQNADPPRFAGAAWCRVGGRSWTPRRSARSSRCKEQRHGPGRAPWFRCSHHLASASGNLTGQGTGTSAPLRGAPSPRARVRRMAERQPFNRASRSAACRPAAARHRPADDPHRPRRVTDLVRGRQTTQAQGRPAPPPRTQHRPDRASGRGRAAADGRGVRRGAARRRRDDDRRAGGPPPQGPRAKRPQRSPPASTPTATPAPTSPRISAPARSRRSRPGT